MDHHKEEEILAEVVANAWMNPSFKQKLTQDPNKALSEAGLDIPEGVQYEILHDTEKVKHVVLHVTQHDFSSSRNKHWDKSWAQMMKKIYQDRQQRQKFLLNPTDFAKKHGVFIGEGIEIRVKEETANKHYLILWIPDDNSMLSESDLERVSGAQLYTSSGVCCCS